MSKREQQRHRERTFAWILVGFLCLVWPLASWHELTTSHEVCAEHGELLDVGSGAQAPDEADEDGPRYLAGSDETHDPCQFAPLAQPATGSLREPVFAQVRAVEFVVSSPLEAPRAPGFPRYLLAPKQSPPIGRAS
ncbi:MAG: hypothetical protein ABL998_10315 [Planctomycetota bacterium]